MFIWIILFYQSSTIKIYKKNTKRTFTLYPLFRNRLYSICRTYLLLFIEFAIIPVLLLERGISKGLNVPYIKQAKRKLANYKGTVIAITGSFGKTSTKVLLNQALNLFSPTIATPKSYNTELGISRFVNESTDLNVFDHMILEFGASHKNDIRHLKK